jgi:hypothetical protein
MSPFAGPFLDDIRAAYAKYKRTVERALAQLTFEELKLADVNGDSIATIMKHLAGNLASRWTNFLLEDGEKPWRNRDSEFVDQFESREELEAHWARGWSAAEAALAQLQPEDLSHSCYIRNEEHTVTQAILRNYAHTTYHVGQIVLAAKRIKGAAWQTLSIPRGQSETHTQSMKDAF